MQTTGKRIVAADPPQIRSFHTPLLQAAEIGRYAPRSLKFRRSLLFCGRDQD
jgi:hypothetical protein